jgi:hypothetical protein
MMRIYFTYAYYSIDIYSNIFISIVFSQPITIQHSHKYQS